MYVILTQLSSECSLLFPPLVPVWLTAVPVCLHLQCVPALLNCQFPGLLSGRDLLLTEGKNKNVFLH